MAKRYELSEEQWRRIAELLPGKADDPGRSGADNRSFVNAVLRVLRSGAHWHDLPPRYGKYKSVHKRFSRWARNRIGRCINKLKNFRRIATRYDRRADHFLAFIHLASSILWMR